MANYVLQVFTANGWRLVFYSRYVLQNSENRIDNEDEKNRGHNIRKQGASGGIAPTVKLKTWNWLAKRFMGRGNL